MERYGARIEWGINNDNLNKCIVKLVSVKGGKEI